MVFVKHGLFKAVIKEQHRVIVDAWIGRYTLQTPRRLKPCNNLNIQDPVTGIKVSHMNMLDIMMAQS